MGLNQLARAKSFRDKSVQISTIPIEETIRSWNFGYVRFSAGSMERRTRPFPSEPYICNNDDPTTRRKRANGWREVLQV